MDTTHNSSLTARQARHYSSLITHHRHCEERSKLIALLLTVCCLLFPLGGIGGLHAQQLRWQWAVQANSTGSSRVCGTACDTSGNIYLTGSFSDTLRFGQQQLIPAGDEDVYWVKFDAEGKVVWAQQAGNERRDIPTAMVVSEAGMIYTAGICGKEAFPGQATTRQFNFFISCHNPAGELQWIKTFGAKRSDHITSIATDTAGHIYFAGYFEGKLTIGDYQFPAAKGCKAFLACVDASGETLWAKSWGGNGSNRITALRSRINNDGVILLGLCDTPFSFGTTTIAPATGLSTAAYTAVCRPDGTIDAINSVVSGQAVDVSCVMETTGGMLLTAGNFTDSLLIGTSVLYSHGNSDMFIVAVDSTGAPAWHKQIGSMAYDRLFEILPHPWGHIIITGLYSGALTCDGDTIAPGNAFCDVFTASFGHDGRLQEVNPMGGRAEEFPQVMTHDRQGHIFVAGLFRDTTQLRHNTLFTASGSDELFLAKLYHCNKNKIVFSCDTIFAEGSLLSLEVQGDYTSYEWEHGASMAANYVVNCSKTYQVLVSDSLACVYRDSITVQQVPVAPKVQIRAQAFPSQGLNVSTRHCGCFVVPPRNDAKQSTSQDLNISRSIFRRKDDLIVALKPYTGSEAYPCHEFGAVGVHFFVR